MFFTKKIPIVLKKSNATNGACSELLGNFTQNFGFCASVKFAIIDQVLQNRFEDIQHPLYKKFFHNSDILSYKYMTICQTCKFCHIFFLEIQNKIKNFFFFDFFFHKKLVATATPTERKVFFF